MAFVKARTHEAAVAETSVKLGVTFPTMNIMTTLHAEEHMMEMEELNCEEKKIRTRKIFSCFKASDHCTCEYSGTSDLYHNLVYPCRSSLTHLYYVYLIFNIFNTDELKMIFSNNGNNVNNCQRCMYMSGSHCTMFKVLKG